MFLYILRSVPGAGKTTLANSLNAVVCSADDYMVNAEGQYEFNPSRLHYCHKSCYNKAEEAMKNQTERIVIANTNVRERDVNQYKKLGESYGYYVFSLVVENRHGNSNVHDVPAEKLLEMESTLKKSIKLI